MPRVYKPAPGSRRYKSYDEHTLQKAILEVTKGRLSLRKAANYFKISIGTLSNKIKGKHNRAVGGTTALSCQEEKALAECLVTCADGGLPLSPNEIKSFTKYYLQSIGKFLYFIRSRQQLYLLGYIFKTYSRKALSSIQRWMHSGR